MKGNLAIRVSGDNPNHHLWNNNGVWFLHYTVHPDALTKQRVRCSLKTKSLPVARRKRNRILAEVGQPCRTGHTVAQPEPTHAAQKETRPMENHRTGIANYAS